MDSNSNYSRQNSQNDDTRGDKIVDAYIMK